MLEKKSVIYIISKETGSILFHYDYMENAIECRSKLKGRGIDTYIKRVTVENNNDSIIRRTLKI